MRKIALFFLTTFIYTNSFSQDLKIVDKVILSYQEASSIEDLAARIDYDFKTKREKVRAIYTWIALNIEYDNLSTNSLKAPIHTIYFSEFDLKRIKKRKQQQVLNHTFKSKKGVCYGNALLFKKLCDLINIKNELIYGYTKSSVNYIGIVPLNKNHVWNATKINGKWLLFDVTYGSGYVYKNVWQRQIDLNYFNVKKEKLRLTHFPSSNFWRRFLKQKPLKAFCLEPFYQDAYLKHKIEISEPKTGEITLDKNNKIHLKFKNLEKITNIKYVFSDDKKIRTALIKNKGYFTNVYFKNPKRNTNLHIYIEDELAIEYKVKLH